MTSFMIAPYCVKNVKQGLMLWKQFLLAWNFLLSSNAFYFFVTLMDFLINFDGIWWIGCDKEENNNLKQVESFSGWSIERSIILLSFKINLNKKSFQALSKALESKTIFFVGSTHFRYKLIRYFFDIAPHVKEWA